MAQFSELSHFILITKTDTNSVTKFIIFLIAFSGFAIGSGTRYFVVLLFFYNSDLTDWNNRIIVLLLYK